MKIQSTLIKPSGKDTSLVEILVSADAAQAQSPSARTGTPIQPQADSDQELVLLRLVIPTPDNYFSGIQSDAIKRAIKILEAARDALVKKNWE